MLLLFLCLYTVYISGMQGCVLFEGPVWHEPYMKYKVSLGTTA